MVLILLGNANYCNNLTRRFIIKRNTNPKHSILCGDEAHMTRFLFGDDFLQCAKQKEKSEKLKMKISNKKNFLPWKFGPSKTSGGRAKGLTGNATFKRFADRFHPYSQRWSSLKGMALIRLKILLGQEMFQSSVTVKVTGKVEAGQLSKHLHEWCSITRDEHFLDIVAQCYINTNFQNILHLFHEVINVLFSGSKDYWTWNW